MSQPFDRQQTAPNVSLQSGAATQTMSMRGNGRLTESTHEEEPTPTFQRQICFFVVINRQ